MDAAAAGGKTPAQSQPPRRSFSPRADAKRTTDDSPLHLRTAFGAVALGVGQGKDPADGHWSNCESTCIILPSLAGS